MNTREEVIQRSLKCIGSLESSFQQNVMGWFNHMMNDREVLPLIYYGFRSEEQQQKLYDLYKAGKGGKANAPGTSYHNYGLAFDWVPMIEIDDLPGHFEADWNNDLAYQIGEDEAKEFEVRPISEETGHLQDARCKTWEDAKRVYEAGLWPNA